MDKTITAALTAIIILSSVTGAALAQSGAGIKPPTQTALFNALSCREQNRQINSQC